ncbi:hypothetical protein BKI52_42470 [marine bacterium AO1-C]|nr:hypothetical protein BKI52_42470 [marine bacterium AO1-C]
MKTFRKVLRYLAGIVLLLIGILTITLEEPLYGVGFLILGILLLPWTSSILSKKAPAVFSSKLQIALFIGLSLLIVVSVSLFGRKTYDKTENITPQVLSGLSKHPVKKARVNNLDYYYLEKGQGPVILLLHGFPDMANTWDETIAELSKNYRVIAPFLRGYYPTSIPTNMDFSVKSIAGDMVQLMEKLAIKEWVVVGQDWGASISYATANLAPNKVKKVVSIAIPHPTCLKLTPGLLFAGRHFLLFGTGNYGVRYTRKNDFAYIDRLYQRWSPDYKGFQKSSNEIKETFKFPHRLEAALGYYTSLGVDQGKPDIVAFYQKIPQVPVLFLVGEQDGVYTEDIVQAMNQKMPKGSKSVVFKNAGHFLHREVFADFMKELRPFLQ